MRRRRNNFAIPYHTRYGVTREIRGEMMANNIVPFGNIVLPEVKHFRGLNTVATFTASTNLYVEDLFDRPNNQIKQMLYDRTFIVVRSQKFSTGREKYYFVHLRYPETLNTINLRHIKRYLVECTCMDPISECKHKYAIKFSIQGHGINLR